MRSLRSVMQAGSRLRPSRCSKAKVSLDQIEALALKNGINPQPRSGKQEQIENLLARLIYSDNI